MLWTVIILVAFNGPQWDAWAQGSSKGKTKLKDIQSIIKEIHSVGWLSYFNAQSTVQRILDSLLTYLAEADGNKDAKAAGLQKKIANESFILITYMMMDAMAPVTILSQFLQTENVDLALVKVKIDLCISDLERIKTMKSTYLQALKEELDVQPGFFKGHSIKKTNWNLENLTSDFIDTLKENILSRFPSNDLLSAFSVLALRPISFLYSDELEEFGVKEIDTLCQFCGKERTVQWFDENGNHKNTSELVISGEETKAEWTCLKSLMKRRKENTFQETVFGSYGI